MKGVEGEKNDHFSFRPRALEFRDNGIRAFMRSSKAHASEFLDFSASVRAETDAAPRDAAPRDLTPHSASPCMVCPYM